MVSTILLHSTSSRVTYFVVVSRFKDQVDTTMKTDVESLPDSPPVVDEEQSLAAETKLAEQKSLDEQISLAEQKLFEIRNLNEIPPSLYRWNAWAAVFQFVQALTLLYLSSQANTKWLWFTFYPLSLEDSADSDFGKPGPEQVAAFSVTWYSAIFIALSGIDHLACIIFERTYNYYIERHQNPFRWAEYAVSASLMRIMIAQISGVTDIHLLWCIFALAALTMLLGGIHESVNAKARADNLKQNWYPFFVSWLAHLASWLIIFNYFFVAVSQGNPPGFVWSIIFILFLLDGTFALLFTLQWLKIGRFSDYVVGEKGFILLSFTAKALLAWINYGGGSR
jgi:hypothetical protein